MVKKGMSREQKRETILGIFHEADEVFQLKDIERQATKLGVVSQSVKEVLQELVNDDEVHQDKIGISNFFWSFKAESSTKLKNVESQCVESLKQAQAAAQDAREQLAACKAKEEDGAARAALQAQLNELQAEKEQLQQAKASLEVVDPRRFEALVEAIEVCRQAANRWVDNISNIMQWCKKMFAGREKDVDDVFEDCGWSENIDYIAAGK